MKLSVKTAKKNRGQLCLTIPKSAKQNLFTWMKLKNYYLTIHWYFISRDSNFLESQMVARPKQVEMFQYQHWILQKMVGKASASTQIYVTIPYIIFNV